MNDSQVYIAIAIVALAIIALLVFVVNKNKGKKQKRITPLAGLAFGFILAGIAFGNDRLIGYSLIGIGVILSIADIFIRPKEK